MATLTVPIVCPNQGDYDADCDVDGEDLTLFEQCASGPAVAYAEGCGNRDLDEDGDVDQSDFGAVLIKHTVPVADIAGSNTAIPPTQISIPLPALAGADVSVFNTLTVRM